LWSERFLRPDDARTGDCAGAGGWPATFLARYGGALGIAWIHMRGLLTWVQLDSS